MKAYLFLPCMIIFCLLLRIGKSQNVASSVIPSSDQVQIKGDFKRHINQIPKAQRSYFKSARLLRQGVLQRRDEILQSHPSLSPEMSLDFGDQLVDDMMFVDEERLALIVYEKGCHMMLKDMKQEKPIWKVEAPHGMKLYSTNPVILGIAGSEQKKMYAFDPHTGNEIGEYFLAGKTNFSIINQQLIISGVGYKESYLKAYDLTNGSELWRQVETISKEESRTSSTPSIQLSPDKQWFFNNTGTKIQAVQSRSGKIIWQTETANKNYLTVREKEVLLVNDSLFRILNLYDGGIKHELEFAKVPLLYKWLDDQLLFVNEGEGRGSSLDCYEISSASRKWSAPLTNAPTSAIYFRNSLILMSFYDRLTAIDPNDGRLVYEIKYPLWYQQYSPALDADLTQVQPDEIHFSGDRMFIYRIKGGLIAAHATSGDWLWAQHTFHAGNFSSELAEVAKEYSMEYFTLGQESNSIEDVKRYSDSYFSMMKNRRQIRYNHLNDPSKWRQSNSASIADLKAARNEAKVQSILNLVFVAGEIAIKMTEHSTNHRFDNRIQEIRKMERNAFQDQYFIRPFSDQRGSGYTIVELQSGDRADLYVCPNATIPDYHDPDFHWDVDKIRGRNFIPFIINPFNGKMVSLNYGLNLEDYVLDEKKKRYQFPKRKLQIYDIKDLAWDTSNALQEQRQKEKELRKWTTAEWAARGVTEKVLDLLDQAKDPREYQDLAMLALTSAMKYRKHSLFHRLITLGIDINVRHSQTGKTPLMFIVENGQILESIYLMRLDADPGIKDFEGQSALIIAEQNKYPLNPYIYDEARGTVKRLKTKRKREAKRKSR